MKIIKEFDARSAISAGACDITPIVMGAVSVNAAAKAYVTKLVGGDTDKIPDLMNRDKELGMMVMAIIILDTALNNMKGEVMKLTGISLGDNDEDETPEELGTSEVQGHA